MDKLLVTLSEGVKIKFNIPFYFQHGEFSRDFQKLSNFFNKSPQNYSLPLNYIKRVLFAFFVPIYPAMRVLPYLGIVRQINSEFTSHERP